MTIEEVKKTIKNTAVLSVKPAAVENEALNDLLKKPKFLKTYKSKGKKRDIQVALYIKQYALLNYDSIFELLAKREELQLWENLITRVNNYE